MSKEVTRKGGPSPSGREGPLSPAEVKDIIRRELFSKAMQVYDQLLVDKDPKVRGGVAKDILELVGGKEPEKNSQPQSEMPIPPEYLVKMIEGLSKLGKKEGEES